LSLAQLPLPCCSPSAPPTLHSPHNTKHTKFAHTTTHNHPRLPPPSLLASRYLAEDFYDLVDVDSFGSETLQLPAAIDALKFGGMLFLTSTDGISSAGGLVWIAAGGGMTGG
jgi:hypothetical protein